MKKIEQEIMELLAGIQKNVLEAVQNPDIPQKNKSDAISAFNRLLSHVVEETSPMRLQQLQNEAINKDAKKRFIEKLKNEQT